MYDADNLSTVCKERPESSLDRLTLRSILCYLLPLPARSRPRLFGVTLVAFLPHPERWTPLSIRVGSLRKSLGMTDDLAMGAMSTCRRVESVSCFGRSLTTGDSGDSGDSGDRYCEQFCGVWACLRLSMHQRADFDLIWISY